MQIFLKKRKRLNKYILMKINVRNLNFDILRISVIIDFPKTVQYYTSSLVGMETLSNIVYETYIK